MSPRRSLFAVALCAVALPCLAQDAPSMAPPKYLFISEENVKPGKNAAHDKHEAAILAEYIKADTRLYLFGMSAITGGSTTLFITGFNAWDDVAKNQAAIGKVPGLADKLDAMGATDGEMLNSYRSSVATFQPDITVGSAPDFAKVHGYRITTYRVRIGHTDEFVRARKMLKTAWEASGTNMRLGTFAVTQGVAQPTYLVFRPFTNISEFDADSANNAALARVANADSNKVYDELLEKSLLSRETDTYFISPRISYVPATFAASDKFWDASPTVVAAKNAAKSGVTQAGTPRKAKAKQ